MAQPRVSAIIATYNWSSVLRLAIESALLQTFPDFELLVVGDACTDDSEQVVSSFRDPRVSWTNLAVNSGSQHGPNNYGIQAARGEYIAYLGTDDLWYPTHLESLVRTMDRTQADMAGGIAILYGPPYSGVRGVTGVLEGGHFGNRDFMVPSSLIHKRSLIERIGLWRDPRDMVLLPDCDFERRAFEAGARIESTGEVSVFKFNAAWRRNSYLSKRDDEQREMMAKIRSAEDFRQTELVEVVRAYLEGRSVRIKAPQEGTVSAGELTRYNSRFKGLAQIREKPGLKPLERPIRFGLEDQLQGFEWYALETHGTETFRWSGPSRLSTVEFPVYCTDPLLVRAGVIFHYQQDLSRDVDLMVNGERVTHTVASGTPGYAVLEAAIPHTITALQSERPLSVSFLVKRTCRPSDLGDIPDERWLGLAVSWVELTPIVMATGRG
jgi:glycosyltransferase involved in cell wall biosynthesis